MAAKSLSTSTLSLKFMQNAQRAKNLKEVELDRAEVKDDGKWEISQHIRDSWGITNERLSESSDVHEASYLPFLFSGDTSTNTNSNVTASTSKPTGRRTFNKKGEDISLEPSTSDSATANVSTPSVDPPPSKGRKVHPRPVSITASGASGHLRGFEEFNDSKDSRLTARQAMFESGGVGTDLRGQVQKPPKATFMKPAGIDDPQPVKNVSSAVSSQNNIISGAREKKVKRQREAPSDDTNDTTKKSKKKKRKNPE
ncbi:hypothetical protein JR316_0010771 [Psilocybe cubensis]|uniref:Uncharacterized protein n=2 Tax=Psilocybe cubensis TaxID=181762 RepID=A0A8H7XXX3_PSICU|nr:hypothetical protein JR316_0010771 [Psilocybe cubensis]KAH9476855.1 hypothetical protein JR316_0010771 [Psilocybe cubensis]